MISRYQEQLSTGLKLNRASDSPSSYVIAKKMDSKAQNLGQAQENISQAIGAMSEADTALTQMQGIILNMKLLAQQAAPDTMSIDERKAIE